MDWNQRYATPEFIYGTDPNDFVAEMADQIPAGPVLCLAEGEGRNAVFLSGRGHAVTAIDSSESGLKKARELAATRRVKINTYTLDLAHYEIMPSAWAGIVATWAHLPPELRRAVFGQAVQGLIPGGVFILEAYTPAQIAYGTGGPKDPNLCMTLAALREELAGLEFIIGRECERNVVEGIGHTGRASVVQVLARRPT